MTTAQLHLWTHCDYCSWYFSLVNDPGRQDNQWTSHRGPGMRSILCKSMDGHMHQYTTMATYNNQVAMVCTKPFWDSAAWSVSIAYTVYSHTSEESKTESRRATDPMHPVGIVSHSFFAPGREAQLELRPCGLAEKSGSWSSSVRPRYCLSLLLKRERDIDICQCESAPASCHSQLYTY